jgi:hypothetical protein
MNLNKKTLKSIRYLSSTLKRARFDEMIAFLYAASIGSGTTYFVDPTNGRDGNEGTSPDTARKTMAYAISQVEAGDTIAFTGTILEDGLTLATDNVRIVGLGTSPRANVWQQAAATVTTGDITLLTVTGKNCTLANIRFRAPTGTSTAKTAVALSGATGLTIEHCQFTGRTGSYYGIDAGFDSDGVTISDCLFANFNTATYGTAIYGNTYTNNVCGSKWLIENCTFTGNLLHLSCRLRESVIRGNVFNAVGLGTNGSISLTATTKINLSGTAAGGNAVTGNMLGGTYSHAAGYTEATDDNWAGNFITAGASGALPV